MFGSFQFWMAPAALCALTCFGSMTTVGAAAAEFGFGANMAVGHVRPGTYLEPQTVFGSTAFVDFAENHRFELMGSVGSLPIAKYGAQYLYKLTTLGPSWTITTGLGAQYLTGQFSAFSVVLSDPTTHKQTSFVSEYFETYGPSARGHARYALRRGVTLNFGIEAFYGLSGRGTWPVAHEQIDEGGRTLFVSKYLPVVPSIDAFAIFVLAAVEISTGGRKTE